MPYVSFWAGQCMTLCPRNHRLCQMIIKVKGVWEVVLGAGKCVEIRSEGVIGYSEEVPSKG
jgi:hypothetical protein